MLLNHNEIKLQINNRKIETSAPTYEKIITEGQLENPKYLEIKKHSPKQYMDKKNNLKRT